MTASNDNLSDLRPNYLSRLGQRVSKLNDFLETIERRPADAETIENTHRCVHSMISSAAIFGYPDLSAAARAAELAFESDGGDRAETIKQRVEIVVRLAQDVLRGSAITGS